MILKNFIITDGFHQKEYQKETVTGFETNKRSNCFDGYAVQVKKVIIRCGKYFRNATPVVLSV